MNKVVKSLVRKDGLVRVEIFSRNYPPTFGFCEEAWREYEYPHGELYGYWSEVRNGTNFYESADAAEAEARAVYPWLAEATQAGISM